MDNNQDWLEFYQQRDQWAITAYEKFINQVDDALKADLKRSDQITIVVYGSTQVGKTSLILKILGINDVHMAKVSTLLRGGREIGKSATIMPIRYRRSEDDQWHIHDMKGKDTTVSTVEEYFKNLRKNIEKGQTNTTNIIDVYIPQYYFSQQLNSVLDIRILDLPGIQALNENEQEHVRQISAKYAANADLILLVGRSDDLAFLNPSRLMLDQFKYWTSQPSRFRVILTRAFSPATVIDYVKQSQITFNLETFKGRIFEQLGTHDFQIPKECRNIIFPLEFGDSLENIKEKHADYFELIDSVNQNSFMLLHEGICKAANPYSRFKNGFDVQRLAKIRIEEEKNNFNNDNTTINQELEDLIKVISSLNKKIKEKDKLKKNNLLDDEYLAGLQRECSTSWFQNKYNSIEFKRPDIQKVSSLKEAINTYTRDLKNKWDEVIENIGEKEENIKLELRIAPSLDTKKLKDCDDKLNKYSIDKYWLESTFEADYQMLKNVLNEEGERYAKDGWDQLTKYINQQRMKIKKNNEKLMIDLQQLIYLGKNKLNEVRSLQEQKSDLNLRHQDFITRMKMTEKHGETFESLMKESFEEFSHTAKIDFYHEQDLVKKFYLLWYSMLLATQYDEMMLGVKA